MIENYLSYNEVIGCNSFCRRCPRNLDLHQIGEQSLRQGKIRLCAISHIIDVFSKDSRYIVNYANTELIEPQSCFKLFLASTKQLLAEFTNDGSILFEYAFQSSFSEINKRIDKEVEKVRKKFSI